MVQNHHSTNKVLLVVYKEIKSEASHISFDFDEEADTLYISFEKPQMQQIQIF